MALWTLALGVPAGAQEGVAFLESPLASLGKTRQLLDAADLRIMLPLGYQYTSESGILDQRMGVLENRVFVKGAPGQRHLVEIAIAAGVGGNYEFVLTGQVESQEGYAPNPELEEVRRRFEALIRRSRPSGSAQVELAYEMFRLGHIEADRALSLLKALGYHTVEFEEKPGKAVSYEKIFDVVQGKDARLPWIVKVVNASKTSLLQEDPLAKGAATTRAKGTEGAPQLGGSHLHNTTTGAPEERLLLVYDRNDPEPLERLVNLLQTQIDVPTQQIVIEALVIEVNTSKLQDIGIEWSAGQGSARGSFERSALTGNRLGTFAFSRDGFTDFVNFRASLEALAESGDAEVLSSPSVLVLNDRQARIQVGRQIPVIKTTATTAAVSKGTEYFPVGIVLNLRPRINREGSEVTMQIETIISSISPESAARLEAGAGAGVEFSPIVDNRLVETYVRVADGTPFIIGGLLSTERQESKIGLPFIASLPLLGRLFSRERLETDQREVIVVITPHIVPLEEKSFSYLIPKDSGLFDRFDTRLFRNAYRVRDDDVWDLKFIVDSPVLQKILRQVQAQSQENVMLKRQEPFQSLLAGRIPGEGVLVRRMLYEIVGKLNFHREVNLEQIFFFTPPEDETRGKGFSDDLTLQDLLPFALQSPQNAAVLMYQAQPVPRQGQAFSLPLATVRDTVLTQGTKGDLLWDLNVYQGSQPQQWAIVLADQEDVERLRKVLILKLVLSLNKNLPHTLQAFRSGVQILFPTREDMRNRYHLIDREVAQLFYETTYPYQVAQRMLNDTVRQVYQVLGGAP